MDGTLVIIEGSLLPTFLLLQRMIAFSLWKVVHWLDFGTLMDGSLVITVGSLLLTFFNSNEWYPCHYGR